MSPCREPNRYFYERLKNRFELGVDVTLLPMHKDRERDGKLLGRARPPNKAPNRRPVATTADVDVGQ